VTELHLDMLPMLPQRATIVEAASHLWQNEDVIALWLGGSLAHGAGDLYSDVDFRVAVEPQQLASWKSLSFEAIFAQAPVMGQHIITFGDDAFLYHLLLSNGEIFDFFVQSTERSPTAEPVLILGCHSESFEHLLVENNNVPRVEIQAVHKELLQQMLIDFWISTHKHRKVLYRNLDLMVPQGLQAERGMLLRLWYIQATGQDCGDMGRQTIHSLTRVVRAIGQSRGAQALATIGASARDRRELCCVIELHRGIIAQAGRELAQTYMFEYPAALEATVLRGWKDFMDGEVKPIQ